jgi:NADH:quinone reductase (non-electrogenic)
VVIVGGGFGGLACARKLDGKPLDVLLIDVRNYHLFTPLLYQVGTALLNPSDIAVPFRAVFRRSRNVRFLQALVTGVDLEKRHVSTNVRGEIGFDYLVVATGSTNNYFGNPDLADSTLAVKTMGEAQALRLHVLSCLERAAEAPSDDERRRWLTFVIVGGGPTGVEYAGAISELMRLVLGRDYPELRADHASIVLVEGHVRLLGAFPERLGLYAQRILVKRGVEVVTGTVVDNATADRVTLSTGRHIETRTVVWSAGVRPLDPLESAGPPRSATGRVTVDGTLRVVGHDGVFVIGDAASVAWEGGELVMLSPPAMQEGRHAAREILAAAEGKPSRKAFRYRDKGTMAVIGRNAAVAVLGPLRFTGFLAWLSWLFVHLFYIVGFRNRIAVLVLWGWNYVRKDRPIRLIIRANRDPVSEELLEPLGDHVQPR